MWFSGDGESLEESIPRGTEQVSLKTLKDTGFTHFKVRTRDGTQNELPNGLGGGESWNEFKIILPTPIEHAITVDKVTNGVITPCVTQATAGTEIVLEISPLPGYRLKDGSLKVTTQSGVNIAVSNNRFIMPAEDVTISALFEEDTAVDDISSKSIKIFLDSSGKIQICGANPKIKVELYNLQGIFLAKSLTNQYGEASLEIAPYPSGMYLVRVGSVTTKLIKNF